MNKNKLIFIFWILSSSIYCKQNKDDMHSHLKLNLEGHVKNEDEIDFHEGGIYRDSETGISLADGEISKGNISDVINIAPGYNPRTFICQKKDLTIEMDGKIRIEGSMGKNTILLNSLNGGLDTFLIPGKSTIDFGFGIAYGNETYGREILNLGFNFRSRNTWGKPDQIAGTTISTLKTGDLSYGSHKHNIGIPLLYVRGFDLTIDLNALSFASINEPLHHLKLGFFPLEIGRGISLGAAYAVTPDFLTYEPGDIIQEFAPGILIQGAFDKKLHSKYRSYIGIFKNNSANFVDTNEPVKAKYYNMQYNPQRGFGVFNIVWATQFDWTAFSQKNRKVIISPYFIFGHEGEEKTLVTADSGADLATLGFVIDGSCKATGISFNLEFAKNFGSQNVYGIDLNNTSIEQRTYSTAYINFDNSFSNNTNTTASVVFNTAVNYIGNSATTDLQNKPATYLGSSSPRQIAINSVFQGSASNGQIINYQEDGAYILQNSDLRFRDGYTNILNGFMGVFDITYDTILCDRNVKLAFATGYASGDENPNASLKNKNDFIQDTIYNGFVSLQEIYSGKSVRSVFLLSGVGKMPRILSIPGLENLSDIQNTDYTKREMLGYPSKITKFNNIAYFGTSCVFNVDTCNYNWKVNPNALIFFQPVPPSIYNVVYIQKLGKDRVSSFLGTECNLFLEIMPHGIDIFKFFVVGTIFFPGYYYSDLKGIPLDKEQLNYIANIEENKKTVYVPMLGTSPAFYLNIGLEFKY